MGPNPVTSVPVRRGKSGHSVLSDLGRSHVLREAGTGVIVSGPRSARASGSTRSWQGQEVSSPQVPEAHGPAHTWVSDVWPAEL